MKARSIVVGGPEIASRRALVVGRDRYAIQMAVCTLEGFEVVVEPDAPRAILRLAGEPFDLILCDVKASGLAFYDRVVRHYGHLQDRFAFTADSEPSPAVRALEALGVPLLRRPFRSDQLSAVVAALTGAPPS